VRPIILLEGTHEVNEVWFTDVRVPAENLVGEENKGWTYAKYLLVHERSGIAGVGAALSGLEHLKHIAADQMKDGKPLLDDPFFAARLAEIEVDLSAMRTSNLRVTQAADDGAPPGPETSMLKIKGTEIRQSINDLTRRALGTGRWLQRRTDWARLCKPNCSRLFQPSQDKHLRWLQRSATQHHFQNDDGFIGAQHGF